MTVARIRITKQACLSPTTPWLSAWLLGHRRRAEGLSPEFALPPKRMLPGVAGRIPDDQWSWNLEIGIWCTFAYIFYFLSSISQKWQELSRAPWVWRGPGTGRQQNQSELRPTVHPCLVPTEWVSCSPKLLLCGRNGSMTRPPTSWSVADKNWCLLENALLCSLVGLVAASWDASLSLADFEVLFPQIFLLNCGCLARNGFGKCLMAPHAGGIRKEHCVFRADGLPNLLLYKVHHF